MEVFMSSPMDRTEHGVLFVWKEDFWQTVPSDTILRVSVIPPSHSGGQWTVWDAQSEPHPLIGKDAETRSFSIAAESAQQKKH